MVPLSRLLGFVSEDLALRFHSHPGLGRLLIVSSGNVIEVGKIRSIQSNQSDMPDHPYLAGRLS